MASYQFAFQPSWRFGQPRQRQQPAPAPQAQAEPRALPANSAQQQQQPVVPFDAGLTDQLNTADLNYGNTLAAIAAQQPVIQREFGYNEQGQIDPNNPFSKAQLLQRAYKQTKAGTTNSMAARGQLYSGATQRQQNENQFNYQAQDAQLRGSYAQQLAQLQALRAAAANDRNNARSSAYWDWVMGQIEARAAAPAEQDAGMVPAVGDGSFQSYLGTPVEAYLRALAGQQQYAPPATPLDTLEPSSQPYNIPVAPNSPQSVQTSAGASGLGGIAGMIARRRGRR